MDSSVRGWDPSLIETMEGHEQAIIDIDKEIQTLLRDVRQLQFKKSTHLERIMWCKGMMMLARRIPPEILATIFEECVNDGWTRTPLIASHVCSEWRKAATIPTVWSHVYINCDARDPKGRTRFWLERAQASLLHITIDVRSDASQLGGIMKMLLKRAAQWQIFTINSTLLWPANYIISLCKLPFPELLTVDISILEEFQDTDDQLDMEGGNNLVGLVESFAQAPRFQTLLINRNTLPSQGALPPAITNLSITIPLHSSQAGLSIRKLLRVLEGLPQLKYLSLALPLAQERVFNADDTRIVELPALTTLVVVGSQSTFTFLRHVIAPALAHLHLRSSLPEQSEEETGSCIRDFIRRSPQVELFELHDIYLPISDITACLVSLPLLQELRLHESDINDTIIDGLLGFGRLCPKLRHLDLRWCGQVTGHALVSLVRSRLFDYRHNIGPDSAMSVNPIDRITVINCAFVEEGDIVSLAQSTVCRVVMETHDYCRFLGCCQNTRYRRRLWLHRNEAILQINKGETGRLIL